MSAFAGLRIIDCSTGIAGAMATMFLADFGAEVIRIEPPGGGPLAKHPGALCWNRNKLRLGADIETAAGQARVHELLPSADAIVFDQLPGFLERSGFGHEELRRANPSLVRLWMPPYGASESWAGLPASDALLSALTGISHLQASEPGLPVRLVTPQATYAHGMLGALTLAAALLGRERDGFARSSTVTGLHAVSAIESGGLVKSAAVTRMFGRGTAANYRLYPCSDGEWLFFGALTPAFFLRALQVMEIEDLIVAPGIDGEFTNILQQPGSATAIEWISRRMRERTAAEWEHLLHDAGIPVARAGSREEWFRGETIAAHGMRVTLPHPGRGEVELPGIPISLSGTPGSVRHLMHDATTVKPLETSSPAPRPGAAPLPLSGIRVLDLGGFVAGPFGPTLLASLGADVIKVEPLDGDPFRTYGLTFVAHNRGKRSLALDLKQPAGLDAFRRLAATADVVAGNYRPGVRERLGISHDELARRNPRLISCSVTGYGGKGPCANDPGFDPLVQAQGGLMAAQGGDGPPVFHQVAVNDTSAALTSMFGVVAALFARERTGRGQQVETNLAVQAVICQSGELTSYPGCPEPLNGAPGFLGPRALDRLYRCTDGWLAIACETETEAAALAEALPGVTWPEPSTLLEASPGSDIARAIESTIAGIPRDHLIARFRTAGVPAAPALTVDEVAADTALRAEGFLDDFTYAEIGPMTGVAGFASWHGTPSPKRATAPRLGEHTRDVLRQAGLDEPAIDRLLSMGVIREATALDNRPPG